MRHRPVLLKESIEGLNLKAGSIFVDGTVGDGGHSRYVCQKFGKKVKIVGIDLDEEAVERSGKRLRGCDVRLEASNFRDLNRVLVKFGIAKADAVIFDLGVSSHQLNDSGRGFSFQKDEPLLMTMAGKEIKGAITAADIVNRWGEESIYQILRGYGEEKFAGPIARKIVELRKERPIKTAFDLVKIVEKATPVWYRKKKKIHFATRTFQALRIAVNDELQTLKAGLRAGFKSLKSGGRIAVISFHSLEDRIVKRFFKEKYNEGSGQIITKKPIVPGPGEILKNPRSRSAKLRILEKNDNQSFKIK